MNATTMSYGVRARERMPFAWDPSRSGWSAALLLVGLIMVTSASMSIAAKDLGDPFYFLERQFAFGLVGVLCAVGAHAGAGAVVGQIQPGAAAVGPVAAALGADSRPGCDASTARGVGCASAPMNFQVSELAKVLVLTWVCSYCVRKRAELTRDLAGLAKPVGLLDRHRAAAAARAGLRRGHRAVRHRLRGAVRRRRAAALCGLAGLRPRRWHSRCSR